MKVTLRAILLVFVQPLQPTFQSQNTLVSRQMIRVHDEKVSKKTYQSVDWCSILTWTILPIIGSGGSRFSQSGRQPIWHYFFANCMGAVICKILSERWNSLVPVTKPMWA